jgi:hypothetical protein
MMVLAMLAQDRRTGATIYSFQPCRADTDDHREKLWELQCYGWIWTVEKNGTPCVPEPHVRKAQFIFHLRQVLKLNPIQISRVLLAEKPHTRSTIMISTGSSQRQGFGQSTTNHGCVGEQQRA